MAVAVNDRSAAVTGMAADWPMLEALMAGTRAMRGVGTGLLPKWPNEDDKSYEARRDTATLFPAYRRTVSVMAGKPFSKALTLSDQTPAEITGAASSEGWATDIDLGGVNLHTFAADRLSEALGYGFCGILVDAPQLATGGAPRTRQVEKAANWRPYFVRVDHSQILGWRLSKGSGVKQLAQLRLLETATVDDGDFGEKPVQRVRVLTPGAWQVFEKSEQLAQVPGTAVWTLIEEGSTGLDFIPFVPIYGRRLAFMCGASPLIDLAFLNVKHWQQQSDQDTILHVARVPVLTVTGVDAQLKSRSERRHSSSSRSAPR
jgi:hypothetical protein